VLLFLLSGIAVGFLLRGGLAAIPIVAAVSLIPMQQRVVLAGLDFDVTRILILAGWLGIVSRKESRSLRLTSVDIAVVTWLVVGTLIHLIRVPEAHVIGYRAGILLDGLGVHFLFRLLVRSRDELEKIIAAFATLALVLAPLLLVEKLTGFNAFSLLGGLASQSWLRDGTIRAQGPFAHPIMAGTYGATLFPLVLGLAACRPRLRRFGLLGCTCAAVIAIAAASSGAILALGFAIVGWAFWFVRSHLRWIRWTVAGALVAAHVVRDKPVWHLIGRLSDFVGGDGYHRYRLIDGFVSNWSDWFLIGTNSTDNWGWGLADVTNQFVLEGVRGGILTFLAFLALLTSAFSIIGKVPRRARQGDLDVAEERAFAVWGWALGVTLAAHCTSWLSVAYFGQMQAVLSVHLALVASLPTVLRRAHASRKEAQRARQLTGG
jgi:hypothetical protein